MTIKSCNTCGKQLSKARLIAKPDAVSCVACLEAAGDVPTYLDEPVQSAFFPKLPFGRALKKLEN